MSPSLHLQDDEVCVRAMGPDDAAFVQRCRNHPDVVRYQSWRPAAVAEVVELAHEQVGRAPGMQADPFQLVIELRRPDGRHLVGDIGTSGFDPGRQMEIGIVLDPSYRGSGLATRACRLLLTHVFSAGLHRVTARVDPRNERSLRLFERLQFRREGLERACWWDDAWKEWTDEVCFAMLREDWNAGPA